MKKCDSPVKLLSDSVGILSAQSESCTETSGGPFNHPVYKQLSHINGQINKMSRDQLINKLEQFHLGIQGTNEILKKRLKTFFKEQKLMQAQILKSDECECPYKYLCVIDFEATCDEDAEYQHEIIEFPAVLIDTKEKKIISTFHEYCRPTLNPLLTEFCKLLTKISQDTIDYAETFTVVLNNFTKWLYHHCPKFEDVAVVTDGSQDMGLFLLKQCEISSISVPEFCKKWINVRKLYSNFYKTTRCNLETMLKILGMTFEGQHHCGRDDALNISKIVIQMLQDGAKFVPNEQLLWKSLPSKTSNSGCYVGSGPISGTQRNIFSINSSEPETTESIQINDKPLDKNSYKLGDMVESVTIDENTKTEKQSNNDILVTEKSEMYNKTKSVEVIEANTDEKESTDKNKCVESTSFHDKVETVAIDCLKKSKVDIENQPCNFDQILTSELQNSFIDGKLAEESNDETSAKSDQALLEMFSSEKNLVLEDSKKNLGNIDNEISSITNLNKEELEGKGCESEICTRRQLSESTKAEHPEKSKSISTKEHKEISIRALREDLHCLGDKWDTVEKELKGTKVENLYQS
ncbi:ERI1 exoribonuclease 2-like [Centruroides vittatus]|uniref:ERI1 exoribonuclease 2-like n=1 Tax=Centruroides vittatus TaxID=120091 RepID=UPI0035102E13